MERVAFSSPSSKSLFEKIQSQTTQASIDALTNPSTIVSMGNVSLSVLGAIRNEQYKLKTMEILQEHSLGDMIELLSDLLDAQEIQSSSHSRLQQKDIDHTLRYTMYTIVTKVLSSIDDQNLTHLAHDQIHETLGSLYLSQSDAKQLYELSKQHEDKFLKEFGKEYAAKLTALQYVLKRIS